MSKASGIYVIRNIFTNKVYVGSSVDLMLRWKRHVNALSRGIHHSKKLQKSWNKYGEDKFKFEIILTCEREELIINEQREIDSRNSFISGYNMAPTAGSSLGRKATSATKAKMSLASRGNNRGVGYKHTNEAKAKIAAALTGRIQSDKSIERIASLYRGKKLSKEHCEKLSASHKGNVPSLKTREKLSLAMTGNKYALGYKHTAETRAKMSKAARNKSAECIKKQSASAVIAWARRKEAKLNEQQKEFKL